MFLSLSLPISLPLAFSLSFSLALFLSFFQIISAICLSYTFVSEIWYNMNFCPSKRTMAHFHPVWVHYLKKDLFHFFWKKGLFHIILDWFDASVSIIIYLCSDLAWWWMWVGHDVWHNLCWREGTVWTAGNHTCHHSRLEILLDLLSVSLIMKLIFFLALLIM